MGQITKKVMKTLLSVIMCFSVLQVPYMGTHVVAEEGDENVEEQILEVTQPTVYTTEIDGITVTATVGEDTFNEEVELVVDPISNDSTEYQKADNALKDSGARYDGMIAFDIYFKVKETGEKIEPDGSVEIQMSLNEDALAEIAPNIDVDSVNVTHITEQEDVEVVADVLNEAEGTVEVKKVGEKVEALDAKFSVTEFSTFTITWTNSETEEPESATVHWGYISDGQFVEFGSDTLISLDTSTGNVSLDVTITDYDYGTAYYCSVETNAPQVNENHVSDMNAVIKKNSDGEWEYTNTVTDDEGTSTTHTGTIEDGGHIYVVYTPHGSGHNPSGADDPDVTGPSTKKVVSPNGDGTYDIQLDIIGAVKKEETHIGANVLIILDTTYSMASSMTGATNRFEAARSAILTLIDTLECDKHDIDLALVEFNNLSGTDTTYSWTKDYATVRDYVRETAQHASSATGTNWEAGLHEAVSVFNNRDTDQTYIIFVTDGEPNRYINDNNGREVTSGADTARTQAQGDANTLSAGGKFYGVFCGSATGSNQLSTLVTNANGVKTIVATSSSAIESEFQSIAQDIVNSLGASNVSTNDGITALSNVSAAVSGASGSFAYYIAKEVKYDSATEKYTYINDRGETVEVNASDVETYYDADGETVLYRYYNRTTWTGAPAAAYSSETGVSWDLSDAGTLKEGEIYSLVFTVWPSQEAYDLIANLNNGLVDYDDLSDDLQEQVYESGGQYFLKTNTVLNTTYTFNGVEYTDDVEFTQGEMELVTHEMDITKEWDDSINPRNRTDVVYFYLLVDGKYYQKDGSFDTTTTNAYRLTTSKNNGWKDSVKIAPGVATEASDGTLTVLEAGHAYVLEEIELKPGDEGYDPKYEGYSQEFTSQTVRPMVINSTLTYLVKVDEHYPAPTGAKTYKIGDDTYYVQTIEEDANGTLVGTNHKTAELDITKAIDKTLSSKTDAELNKETFTYEVTFNVPEGGDLTGINYWIYEEATPEAIADPDINTFPLPEYDGSAYLPYGHVNDRIYMGTKTTIGATSSPVKVTVTINRDQIVRFTNLPTGTTYTIIESGANGSTLELEGYTVEAITTSNASAEVNKNTATVTGTISAYNTRYYHQFNNKLNAVDAEIKVTKELKGRDWAEGDSFKFTLKPADSSYPMPDKTTVTAVDTTLLSFGTIRFTEPGEYQYTLEEENGGTVVNGTTYATNPFATIVIIVERDDGKLVVTDITGGTKYNAATRDNSVASVETKATNTYETVSVSANKAWKKADGSTTAPTSASVEFTLYADGKATEYKVTLNGAADTTVPTTTGGYESEAWVATFVNLPKYNGSTAVVYTIAETGTYAGYTPSTTDPVADKGTITNSQDVTTATGTKAWVNADGTTTAPAGATVTFAVMNGTTQVATVTLDGTAETDAPTVTGGYESAAWVATFVNLPKYEADGTTEITYTIKEITPWPGYTPDNETVANGGKITNKQETVNVFAIKTWLNADGTTDAPANAKVTFTLFADGESTGKLVVLDGNADDNGETPAWQANFNNLPKYQDGTNTVINYTVKETVSWPGYTANPITGVVSGETIHNEQGVTSANAKKEWKNADGSTTAPSGASVVFTLYDADDTTKAIATITLDGNVDENGEATAWTATFTKLPKQKIVNGEAVDITYVIAETGTYAGYKASTTDPVASGETITNSQEVTTADAKKAWLNADGTTDAPANATVTFTLYAGGTATKYTVTLDGTAETTAPTTTGGYESAAWTATFVNLPKYAADGTTEIVYTVAETGTYAGYKASTTDPVASGGTITNSQEVTTADAKKAWLNADGTTDAPANATVTFTLYAGGTATKHTVTLDGTAETTAPTTTGGYESEAWTATFVNLPKYAADGTTEIVYTVAETGTYAGYKASTTDPVASGGTITNSQITTSVTVDKKWVNADDTTTAPEGAEITLTLTADGVKTDKTVKLNAANQFKATVEGLAKYQADGKTEIKYSFEEPEFAGYEGKVVVNDDGSVTVTNTQITTSVAVDKKWVNADDTTTAPEGAEITLTLTADGVKTDKTVKLNAANEFKATVTGLAKYKADGTTEIKYSFTEAEYAGYDSAVVVNDDGTVTVTNTQITTEVPVEKVWKGDENFKVRPESITVQLMNGNTKVAEAELNKENEWKYTFTNLPKYDGKQEIEYSVVEILEVPGYTSEVTGDMSKGYTITNTFEPIHFDPPVMKKVVGDEVPDDTFKFQFEGLDGAPMPEGAEGQIITCELKAGESHEFGDVYLTEPGTYEYKITEINDGKEGYAYDAGEYLLKFVITKDNEGKLACELTINGEKADYQNLTPSQFTFVNEYRKYVDIEVTKVWDDNDNAEGKRPEEIEVTLYANDEAVETVTLNEENNWAYSWVSFEYSDENFEEIQYTVKEDKVPEGYSMSHQQDGYKVTITNTINPPETGDTNNVKLWATLLALSMTNSVALASVALKKRKEEEE